MNMNFIDRIACVFAILGALNWGFFGFFHFNLVSFIFGDVSIFAQFFYVLIGVSGVWMVFAYTRCFRTFDNTSTSVS